MFKKILCACMLMLYLCRSNSQPLRGVVNNQRKKNWTTEGNNIYWGDEKVTLRGISWFGFETQDFLIDGLWVHDMDFYFSLMKNIGINAIRLPFSSEWIYYNYDIYPYDAIITADPSCQHKKTIEIMDMFFDKAEQNGMMILLDLHRLHKEYISELWYSSNDLDYTSDIFFQTWFKILDRYIDRPNLLGIDLLNEPHGVATFGSGDLSTDWKSFVEYAIPKIFKHYPDYKFLVFIEGINWGHTFANYRFYPIDLPDNIMKQVVFSPHIYGQSVVPETTIDIHTLESQWDYDFGYLIDEFYKAVIPGEWGGKTSIDQEWMTMLCNYFKENSITSNFLWSLGPNSGDVAGLLLDDWTTVDGFKLNIIKEMVPDPTVFF